MNTVHATSLESAAKILDLARSKSVNWITATATGRPEFVPNRAHHFVRLTLFNAKSKCMSVLHVVDLVGHGRTPGHAIPFNHGDMERERRVQPLIVSNAYLYAFRLRDSSWLGLDELLQSFPNRTMGNFILYFL